MASYQYSADSAHYSLPTSLRSVAICNHKPSVFAGAVSAGIFRVEDTNVPAMFGMPVCAPLSSINLLIRS